MNTPNSSTNIVRLALPLRYWFRSPILRRRSSLFFAAMVGYPLMAGWLINQQLRPVDSSDGSGGQSNLIHDLKWLDWPFVGYFGLAWLVVMWLLVRPRVRPLPVAVVALIALVTGTPIAIWLETRLPSNTSNLFESIIGVGGSEEFAKIVPLLAALALVLRFIPARASELLDMKPKTWLFLGTVSGVVFGCAEGVAYIVSSQNLAFHGEGGAYSVSWMIFMRLITDPLNHMLWAGVSGYFIGLAVQRARQAGQPTFTGVVFNQGWLIAIGLIIAATLHGLNDFVASNGAAQSLVDMLSALLLLGYALAGDVVEQAVVAAPPQQWGARLAQAARFSAPTAPPVQPVPPVPHTPPTAYPAGSTTPYPVGTPSPYAAGVTGAPYPPATYSSAFNGQ